MEGTQLAKLEVSQPKNIINDYLGGGEGRDLLGGLDRVVVRAQGLLEYTCVGGGHPIPKRRGKKNIVYPGPLATARGGVGDKASHLLESGVV